jgi:hypothetical protein
MTADTAEASTEGAAFAREIIPRLKRCFGSDGTLTGE